MSDKTGISWATATWNPVVGCTPISSGCKNCYARAMALRLKSMGQANYEQGFSVRCHKKMLSKPISWKKPRNIFVVSMGDLFHKAVPFGFIRKVYMVMVKANWHHYFILTKRIDRMVEFLEENPEFREYSHMHHGISVCSSEESENIGKLAAIPDIRRFVSFEPLIDLPDGISREWMNEIEWVVIGGESGPGARGLPLFQDVRCFMDLCRDCGCKVFFKQFGTVDAHYLGLKSRKGDDPSEWTCEFTKDFRIQEYPDTGIDNN